MDELDSSIHFKLTRAIVAMFNNELNTSAQMIFTVHDINLMDCKKMFRKEQIWFVHKDDTGIYIYSLAEFTAQQGVRDTTDIIEKYRKGILGALPGPELIRSLLSLKGNGNIPARYQDKFQNGSYDPVLVFCDTDKKPYEQYADVVLISHNKKKNAPIIFNLTGVGGYKGKAEQRRELFSRITRENYQEMQKRIKNLPSDDAVEGSTNVGKFIEYFSMDDSRWIQMINKTLEGELYQ